jgi:hypothetical protein
MEFKELEDWVSVAGAALILGMSRQAVHSRISRGTFESDNVRIVPTGTDSRPFYLLSRSSVETLASELKVGSF